MTCDCQRLNLWRKAMADILSHNFWCPICGEQRSSLLKIHKGWRVTTQEQTTVELIECQMCGCLYEGRNKEEPRIVS